MLFLACFMVTEGDGKQIVTLTISHSENKNWLIIRWSFIPIYPKMVLATAWSHGIIIKSVLFTLKKYPNLGSKLYDDYFSGQIGRENSSSFFKLFSTSKWVFYWFLTSKRKYFKPYLLVTNTFFLIFTFKYLNFISLCLNTKITRYDKRKTKFFKCSI